MKITVVCELITFDPRNRRTWPDTFNPVLIRDNNGDYCVGFITSQGYWCNSRGHCFDDSRKVMWWMEIPPEFEQ